MAFDAFLKIDGIDGESTVQGYEKWIELLSFSWGVAASETAGGPAGGGGGGGGAAGRASPKAFSFMKLTDSASPNIFLKLCEGTPFQQVSLACRKAGGNAADSGAAPQAFLKIDFFDVFFSSYNEGGNTGTDQQPLESLSFAFAKMDLQVAAMLTDGTLGAVSSAGFNFRTNSPLQPPGNGP